MVQVLVALLLIQVPLNVPGKAVDNNQSALVLAIHVGDLTEILAPGFGLAHSLHL